MYDLQKILLDNYCKKHKIEVVSNFKDKEGVLFYNLKPEFREGEMSYPYITAQSLFPDKFGIEEESEQSEFYPCEY
jgi:hypothetical protein